MSFIFKDIDVEAHIKLRIRKLGSKCLKLIKNNKIFLKAAAVCTAGLAAVAVTVLSTGITVGFNVTYAGKIIAVVRDASVFESARGIAAESVSCEYADSEISVPVYSMTLTVTDKLDTAVNVARAIIENTDAFVYGEALEVNGTAVAYVTEDGLDELLEARRCAFYIEGAENEAYFTDNVKITSGCYLSDSTVSMSEAESVINSLEVNTVSHFNTDTEIAYSTTYVKTASQPIGYSAVTTEGEKGISRKSIEVKSVNGVEASRSELSATVIKEPTDRVITEGTASVRVAATEHAGVSSAGFICPINSGLYTISAYYGDGRNHRGLDLASNKGTSIFAAAAGTVTYAGFDSDYGYNVVINHGNGIETRYAHASALCVSSGDTVSQGDMIAVVGSTGRSTGNHLHFEVIIGGARVNPAPYLGM